MLVYRMSRVKYASDLSGEGNFKYGSRWVPKGYYAVYTSDHPSTAILEMMVHDQKLKFAYCMDVIESFI